jgi:flavin reductase (DIM6/NTAB) family NADH-FMN oxidoreductase RutF
VARSLRLVTNGLGLIRKRNAARTSRELPTPASGVPKAGGHSVRASRFLIGARIKCRTGGHHDCAAGIPLAIRTPAKLPCLSAAWASVGASTLPAYQQLFLGVPMFASWSTEETPSGHGPARGGTIVVSTETQAFEAVVANLDGPAYVVTTAAGDERDGCLVGFASQCSIKPARFAVWLSKENRTYRIAQSAATLVVHLLRQGDQDLAHLFRGETGDEVDKLEDVDWRPGPDGCPVLPRCDWFGGTIAARVDTGDHVGFVIDPDGGVYERSGTRQLGMQEIGDIEAGHPIPES